MIIEVFKSIIYSIEISIVIIAYIVWRLIPDQIDNLLSYIQLSNDQLTFLSLIPIGIFVWTTKISRIILLPNEDTKAIIQKWPDSYKLKIRVLIGLFCQLTIVISNIVLWLSISDDISPKILYAICVLNISSLVGAVTLYFASITVSEISKLNSS